MARELKKLSARGVQTLTKPGRHSDGGGLYLVVDAGGAKRWLFMFRRDGKLKEMGLGGLTAVSLAEARVAAEAARKVVHAGRNPIEERRAERGSPTFGAFADQLIEDLKGGWRNEKHIYQWRQTLGQYAVDLRPRALDEITTEHVLGVLKPIWATKAETASRLRGRIERVLDAAKAKGLRSGENPARWRGHLDQLLPRRQRLARGHHKALPWVEMPGFVARLRERGGAAASALELTILSAARTTEVLEARWCEVDLKAQVWTVPAARMKAGEEHRVPLSVDAVALLERQPTREGLIFPGYKPGKPFSNGAMERVLDRMGVAVTVHGFRSTFRDWAGEATAFPREIAEAALAHRVGDATERAYRRGDALEKRRHLMEEWAVYCGGLRTPTV